MSNRTLINEENEQFYPVLIGDILLHSERKSNPILVISQPLINRSSQTTNPRPSVFRSPAGLMHNQTGILCDLKNTTTVPFTHERMMSFKKFIRLHQVGWSFVQSLKSKMTMIHNHPSKTATDSNRVQQTIF